MAKTGIKRDTMESQAKADAAVEAWRAAKTSHTEAVAQWQTARAEAERIRGSGVHSPATLLPSLVADIRRRESEDEEIATSAVAAAALDAAERADGDALALACAPADLLEDLVAIAAEEARIRTELVTVERRRAARIAAARDASSALASRRVGANLPPPVNLPGHGGPITLTDLIAQLERLVADGPVVVRKNEHQLRMLRREELELRADIERRRRAE